MPVRKSSPGSGAILPRGKWHGSRILSKRHLTNIYFSARKHLPAVAVLPAVAAVVINTTGKITHRTFVMHRKPSQSLVALSASAFALPGIALADSPPVLSTLSYKISNYKEDDVSRKQAPFSERERYDIDVHQFQLLTPVGRNSVLQIDANYESLSGASPWYNIADASGDAIVVMSGASGIEDRRSEISLGGKHFLENGILGANIGYSEEDDYRAVYFGLDAQRNFNNQQTTVAVGYSHSSDDIFPSDAQLFNRIKRADKNSNSGFISASQIINQVSIFQTALSITHHSGFLSDPYKLRDVRPDEKTQIAWSNSYRYFFVNADAALHLNYRYYDDDFGVSSHTFDVAWHQNISNSFRLVPNIRYYSQSAADFYRNTDNFLLPLDKDQSSDPRLSSFGAVSGGLSLVTYSRNWSIALTAERYIANEKYSAYHVQQPGAALLQYFRVSLGVDYSF
jgi:hypothetical protein